MAKTKISEFSATPANNTDIDSINIAEGCAPSGINDAIRELMAQLKDFQTGAVGDSFNGPVGTSTAAAGAFTTLAASGAVTLSGGTANGVTYLNGSKVLTSGSALQFDGTSLFVGATSAAAGKLVVKDTASSNTVWLVGRTSDGASSVSFRNAADSAYTGRIEFDPSVGMLVGTTGATTQLTLSNAGNLGLGVTPSAWNTSVFKALQINAQGALMATSASMQMGNNVFYDGAYKFIGTGYANRYYQTSGQHVWTVSTASGSAGGTITETQAMTLDASGNLGVGTTSPAAKLHVVNTVYVKGSASSDGDKGITIGSGSSAVNTSSHAIRTGGGLGDLLIIETETANSSGQIVFQTNNAERARIDTSGNLLVGTTTTSSITQGFYVTSGSGTLFDMGHASGTGSGAYYSLFRYAGGVIGSITQTGTTAVLYNTTSDQRLKENIIDAPEFGSVIDSIKVRSYDWKSDGSHQRAGFVAQELVTVAPEAVHQPEDTEQMMAVDYSKLVPMLVKEIQSLRVRVAQLETN